MNETRTAYRSDRVLQDAQNDAMMGMSHAELLKWERSLSAMLVRVRVALGKAPDTLTREERRRGDGG